MEKCSIINQKGIKKLKKTSVVKSKSAQTIMQQSKYRFKKLTKLTQSSINDASTTKYSTGQLSRSKILMRSPSKTQKRKKKVNKKKTTDKSTDKKRLLKTKKTKTQVGNKRIGNQHRASQVGNSLDYLGNSLENKSSVPKLRFFKYLESQIPIQNTHERRFVQKLNLVDKENKIRNVKINYQKLQTSSKSVKGEEFCQSDNCISENIDKQTQTSKIEVQKCSTQTENRLMIENKVIEQRVIKQSCDNNFIACLDQFLEVDPSRISIQKYKQNDRIELFLKFQELTNLFLPKNLLQSQSLAQKQDGNRKLAEKQIPNEKKLKQIFNGLINQRWCIQMGWVKIDRQKGINTDAYSVLQYLSNLFCYSQIVEKKQIVKRVRSMLGYPCQQRLKKIQKGRLSILNLNIISDKVFLSLQRQLRSEEQDNLTEQERKQKLQLSCYHNRAIFDCVNQILETYRPFYTSKGEPFPWTISLVGTTYFIIDQDSLQILFKEVKDKVVANCAVLYGIHIQDSYMQEQKKQQIQRFKDYGSSNNLRLEQYNSKQLNQILKEDLKKDDQSAIIEEELAFLLIQVSEIIQLQLFGQLSEQIRRLF